MTGASTESRRVPSYLDVADRIWPLLRRSTSVHTFLYRKTGGWIGQAVPGSGVRMLLLDHVGAKSGTKRTSPLLYVSEGEDVAVIASKGGFPKNPAWYHNLMANPDTTAQIGSEVRPVHARLATPEERQRYWAMAVKVYPAYEDYAARSKGREIPLVVLEPRRV